jgi:hypothetical protein
MWEGLTRAMSRSSHEVLDIGGAALRRRMVAIPTPHVPHNWESHMLFERDSGTVFLRDLCTQLGDGPAVTETTCSLRPRWQRRYAKASGRPGQRDGAAVSCSTRSRRCRLPSTAV